MDSRPRIAVTGAPNAADWRLGGREWEPYAEAVRAAGGHPVPVGPEARGREREWLREADGLLLSGGGDVDLRLYPRPPELAGQDPEALMRARRMKWDSERDAGELALTAAALEADLPLLGICRGCQLLYVALGGRLVLDIPSEVPGAVRHNRADLPEGEPSPRHAVEILPGTRLAEILPGITAVNSRHHQAVRAEPGLPARVAARCPDDGLIEALELPDRRWAIGVQWHPEGRRDPDIRAQQQPLFAAFIAACRGDERMSG